LKRNLVPFSSERKLMSTIILSIPLQMAVIYLPFLQQTDATLKERIPPGQYETKDFPVLSAGPTPRTSLERWNFSIYGEIAEELKWTWDEFQKLPRETVMVPRNLVIPGTSLKPGAPGQGIGKEPTTTDKLQGEQRRNRL
jgi:hypothetical protein